MRKRQSSVTTETQYPVISMAAASLGDCGGPPRPPPRPCARSNAGAIQTAINAIRVRVMRSFSFGREALVHGLDEHVGGPEPSGCAVQGIVVARGPSGLHLIERHALLDQIQYAVANDGQHVAVLNHIGFI